VRIRGPLKTTSGVDHINANSLKAGRSFGLEAFGFANIRLDISVHTDICEPMRDLTSLGQAIVDPTRVRIIAALRQGELCVCELVDALEISQSTLSGHLQVLRQTGLVITRKDGRWIYYSLTDRKTALIEALFSHIQPDGDADPRLRRDFRRIERRLAIRENGRCVLGFTELQKNQTLLK
jgi:ArsR family transcriptional regulator, arsenate/arsenite/antimonite-responsive transcriptional repressor